MLRAAAMERDRDLRIDACAAEPRHIFTRCKCEPIVPCTRIRRQTAAAPSRIGHAGCNARPSSAREFFKPNRNTRGRLAQHCVQYVRRNCAHSTNHFPKRICVIWRCCSAASRNSAARSFSQPPLENRKHLFRALARRAHNVSKSEALFVKRIAGGEFCSAFHPPRSPQTTAPGATTQPILPSRALCAHRCAGGRRTPPSSRTPAWWPTRGLPLRSTQTRFQWGATRPWPMPSVLRRSRQSSLQQPWLRPPCSTPQESHSSRHVLPREARAEILQADWRPRAFCIRRSSGCRRWVLLR